MRLAKLLEQKGISVFQCAQLSGIPYTTLLDLVKGKTCIGKCASETLYKLAKALGVTMESLMEYSEAASKRASFETFKSNVCHTVKEKGQIGYVIEILTNDEVNYYWDLCWYPEAYYVLAMLDYLCRINDIPVCENYNDIRATSLKKTVFPRDIAVAAKLDSSLDVKERAIKESIPEFIRFNIVERDICNVC